MSEEGRQWLGSKVNSERLCRLPVKEVGRGMGARLTLSDFVEVQYWTGKPGIRNIFDFIPLDLLGHQKETPI